MLMFKTLHEGLMAYINCGFINADNSDISADFKSCSQLCY
jgi:hypothetical protein